MSERETTTRKERTMKGPISKRYTTEDRPEAMEDLRAELAEFSHDGLVQLRLDLEAGTVKRGTWVGCALSYKAGAPGSCRRDRRGWAKNAFTVFFDNGWLSDEEVLRAVYREIARRSVPAREPATRV